MKITLPIRAAGGVRASRWLVLRFALIFGVGAAAQASGEKYRGFTLDESHVAQLPNLGEIRAATRQQIDIVCAVGLPAEILQFFQGVPFVFVPAESLRSRTPGLYSPGDRTVKVTSRILTIGPRPVLLHELLHAYHHQRLPQGVRNPAILAFYREARDGWFAAKSHMMQNPGEFFACAATTYLFGVTAQEPFKRATLRERQPKLFAHLQTLFGTAAGGYEGKLPP